VTNTNFVCCAAILLTSMTRKTDAPGAFYRLHTVRAIAEAARPVIYEQRR
jgi:hypothetical protein